MPEVHPVAAAATPSDRSRRGSLLSFDVTLAVIDGGDWNAGQKSVAGNFA